MKCSLGSSNFLEEISSLSHSIVFLYFFALITEEGFLISFCYLELCIQMGLGALNSIHLFLMALEIAQSRIKVLEDLVSESTLPGLQMTVFPLCPHMVRRQTES